MSALLKELAVVAVALLVTVGAMEVLRDRAVLVPPPEKVVEEFVHELTLERWEPARTHLTEALARRLGTDSLRSFFSELEQRVGRIEDVRGRPVFATDAAAETIAEIRTRAGDDATLRLPLTWERGLWKISRVEAGG